MRNNILKTLVITLGVFVGVCQASEQLVKESDRSARKYLSVTRPDPGFDLTDPNTYIGVGGVKGIELGSNDLIELSDSDRTEEPVRVNRPSYDLYDYYRALEIRLRKYWLDTAVKAAESPTPENIQKHSEITKLLVSAASDVNKFVEVKK
jgi:hypothetical protein